MLDTEQEILVKHPKWTNQNIKWLYETPGERNRIREETLLEAPCTKCSKEMGEHTFYDTQFICP
jgi:hypothetical protein